jgi:hypothetical protein
VTTQLSIGTGLSVGTHNPPSIEEYLRTTEGDLAECLERRHGC